MSALRALWAKIIAEPTAVAALVSGVLPLLVLLHSQWLTTEQVGYIGAAIAAALGLIVAFATKHPTLAVCLGLLQAMAALGAAYGFSLSADDMALIVGALGVVAHFFSWAGTGPKLKAAPAGADGPFAITQASDGYSDLRRTQNASAFARKGHGETATTYPDAAPAADPFAGLNDAATD